MIVRPGSSTELVTEAGFQSATMAPPGDLSSKSAKRRLVEKILESRGLSQNQGLEDEILKYLTYKPTDTEADDGLLFWQNHRSDYPTLTKVACYYLSVSASSVPVESMFSITGLILNNKRSSLSPVKLNYLSFIHDNCDK